MCLSAATLPWKANLTLSNMFSCCSPSLLLYAVCCHCCMLPQLLLWKYIQSTGKAGALTWNATLKLLTMFLCCSSSLLLLKYNCY
jgi:hypothetical protein